MPSFRPKFNSHMYLVYALFFFYNFKRASILQNTHTYYSLVISENIASERLGLENGEEELLIIASFFFFYSGFRLLMPTRYIVYLYICILDVVLQDISPWYQLSQLESNQISPHGQDWMGWVTYVPRVPTQIWEIDGIA